MMLRPTDAWLRGLSLVVFFSLWQLVALWVNKPLLPTPSVVLVSLWRELTEGSLLHHLGVTLARVAVSFLIAMALGTALGIVMGRSRRADAAMDSLLVLALNIPALVTIICNQRAIADVPNLMTV